MQDDDFITRENKFMHIKYDNFALTFFTHHTMYLPSSRSYTFKSRTATIINKFLNIKARDLEH